MAGFGSIPVTRDNVELELLYFDIQGKGEAIRLLCAGAGLELKDTRLNYERFMAMKFDGTLAYGQVPCLLVRSKDTGKTAKLVQSAAITRFVGKLAGDAFYPSGDPIKAAQIDGIIDADNDIFFGITACRYKGRFGLNFLQDPEHKPLLDSTYAAIDKEIVPRHLGNLQRLLEDGGTSWLAGTAEPSICDFYLAPRILWLKSDLEGISPNILEPFERLSKWLDDFYALPAVTAYYDKK